MADHEDVQDGEIWLAKQGSSPAWPVLIADEELVHKYFMKANNRPEKARNPDGTWPDRYGPNEPLAGERCLPAMYLCSLKKVWVPRMRLEILNIEVALLERDSNPDPALAQAYGDVVEVYGRNALQYYKDLLFAKQLENEGNAHSEDNGEGSSSQAATRGKTVEMPSCLDNDASDEEDLSAFAAQSTKIKQEAVNGTKSMSLIPSFSDSQSRKSVAPTAALEAKEIEDYGLDSIKVYIGNPHTIFIIKRNSLRGSPVLVDLVSFDSISGPYVMSPFLSSINAGDFRAVAQFLEHGEYYPRLCGAGTEYAYLDGLRNHEDGMEEIVKCGIVYVLAQKLGMPQLQALAFSKFKALQPHPAYQFLVVTGLLFGSGSACEGQMYDFAVDYLAYHFQDLLEVQRNFVVELLKRYPQLVTKLQVRMNSGLRVLPNPRAADPSEFAIFEDAATDIDTSKDDGSKEAAREQSTTSPNELTEQNIAGQEAQEQQTNK